MAMEEYVNTGWDCFFKKIVSFFSILHYACVKIVKRITGFFLSIFSVSLRSFITRRQNTDFFPMRICYSCGKNCHHRRISNRPL